MIGVFDSGVGGLSALLPLSRFLPNADILYYADTAALPLGTKKDSEILDRVMRALCFFEKAGVAGVLLACGTASCLLTEQCKREFTFPMVDVISPTAMAARNLPRDARLLLLATPAAVRSGAFAAGLSRRDGTVLSLACPRLVRLAERGAPSPRDVRRALGLAPALSPDAVVLGCTHFSHLASEIASVIPRARLINAAACAASAAASKFKNEGTGKHRFLVTGDAHSFEARAARLLCRPVAAEKIKP